MFIVHLGRSHAATNHITFTGFRGLQGPQRCVVLGLARRRLTADASVRRYLTDAIFPYYIVHQTAIIMIAHALRGRDLSAPLEAGIVISGTLAACVLTYEVVRRITILRPLFGLRSEASKKASPALEAAQPAQ